MERDRSGAGRHLAPLTIRKAPQNGDRSSVWRDSENRAPDSRTNGSVPRQAVNTCIRAS